MRRRTHGFGECCYHVISRINERRFYMGDLQKGKFLKLLNDSAYFSGVEVLTYSVMDDHFHLLVRVPRCQFVSERDLFKRLERLYRPREYELLCEEYEGYRDTDNEEMMHAFRQRFVRRMYNLSEFMRTLKLRFSLWYNKVNDREGPLWTGRFKSVLVQSSDDEFGRCALSVVATYIDLNAVRAKLVKQAEDYPWCGFARAFAGDRTQREALGYILRRGKRGRTSSRMAVDRYKKLLEESLMPKIDRLVSGWILGQHSFVDFVTRRRPECFRTGHFDITAPVSELPGSGLYTVKNVRVVRI